MPSSGISYDIYCADGVNGRVFV